MPIIGDCQESSGDYLLESFLSKNAFGNSSVTVATTTLPSMLAIITVTSSPNSIKVCLQIPHGATGYFESPQMANARNSTSPSDIALDIAARSAQMQALLQGVLR